MKDDKTVLITGAAKRVGRAMAEDLAARGYAIAIHYNGSREAADELAKSIADAGGRACTVSANLFDATAARGIIPRVNQQMGPVDILVNNASIFEDDKIGNLDAELWDRHFNLHVRAPSLLAADFAAQAGGAHKGLIVNMIDQRVRNLNPRFYSYTLSKSALWTATRTMAQALAPRIRVNAIGPGPTLPSYRQSQDDFNRQLGYLPLKRGAALEDFGRTIHYLAGTPSVTGQMICLDGGQHLTWETPDISGANE